MKHIRMLMLVAALFVGSATVARAQDPQGQARGQRPNRTAMLFNGITLTPQQQTQVDSISARYQAQMRAMRDEMQNGGDRDAMRGKMREMMQKQTDEYRAVLTDDQKKIFDKNVEDMRARMQNRRPGSL